MRMRSLKWALLGSGVAGAACLFSALPAQADEAALMKKIERLEAQIQLLQQNQQDLKKEVADQGSTAAVAAQKADDAQKQAAASVKSSDWKGDLPGSFKIPGTNTSLKLGGRVKLDISNDINGSLGGGVNDYGYVGQGNASSRRSGETQFTARASRLSLETLTPTDMFGPIKSYFEADFYGAATGNTGPDRKNTNSANFRIRQAYVQADGFLAGQAWSTFMDFPSSPELVDSIGGPPGANNGIRQPMLRYSTKFGPGVFSTAVESSAADFNGANQTVFGVGLSVPSNNSIDKVPDVVLKYEYQPSWGSLTGSVVGRWQTLDTNSDTSVSSRTYSADAFGYGALLGGFIRPVEGYKSGVFFQALGGSGIGRYLGPTSAPTFELGAMPYDSAKKLENLFAWGASLGTKVYWTDHLRSTFFYGHDHVSNTNNLLTNTTIAGYRALKNIDAFIANIMWSPFKDPNTYLGLEYTHAYVDNYQLNGTATQRNSGHADRLMGSVSYSF